MDLKMLLISYIKYKTIGKNVCILLGSGEVEMLHKWTHQKRS